MRRAAELRLRACAAPYHEGGAGYNISGLPPAWPDAVVLRGELAKAWKRA